MTEEEDMLVVTSYLVQLHCIVASYKYQTIDNKLANNH